MTSKINMTLRIEPELKKEANALFKSLGLDISTATGLFYRQALRCNGLPFAITNEEVNNGSYKNIEKDDSVNQNK